MTAVHSKNLQVFNATKFKESMALSANLFFTIGNVIPWANEANPSQATTSVRDFYEIWANMIGGKRITANDVRHCIPRYDWTFGTVYTQFDDVIDSKDFDDPIHPFYCMTDQWNVYKCISNNNGIASTEKPVLTSTTGYHTTSDGYIWKYMFTVAPSDRMRFTNDMYIPITPAPLVVTNARNGELSSVVIINSGEDYTDANDISVVITGDGKDAFPEPVVNTTSNTIESILLTRPGSGYTWAEIGIFSSTGTNAEARVVLSPPGGHGSDPYTELGASYLIINPQLKGDEGGSLIVNNEYRQIAIIDEPTYYGSTRISSNSVFSQLMTMTLSGISVEYQIDETVYQGSDLGTAWFQGIVADWDSANSVIKVCNIQGTPINDSLIGANTTARKYVSNIVLPDFQPNSGRLLYKDNIHSIGRAIDQTDAFQIILKF